VLWFLIVPLIAIVVIVGIKVYRNRLPTSIEAGMREFQRGLDALDPDRERRTGRNDDRRGGRSG
jgi:hypothetical protein